MAETKEGAANPVAETEQSPAAGKAGAAARVAARRAAKAARKAAQRGPTEDLVTDKEIAEGVEAASSWLDRNQRVLWGMLAGLLVVGVLTIKISSSREQASRDATEALREAARAAIAPVIAETELADNVKDDDRETFPTEKARATEALAKYKSVIKKFPGTMAARWARLGEGNALLELGRFEEAEKAFRAANAEAEEEQILRFRALEGLGFALEGQKRLTDAKDVFVRAVDVSDGLYRADSDLHVARMLAAEGKSDEAVKRLQALVTLLKERDPETSLKEDVVLSEAEQRLAELGSPVDKGNNGLTPDLMQEIQRQLGSSAKVISGPGQGNAQGAAGK